MNNNNNSVTLTDSARPAVSVINVSKSYGNFKALNPCSFDVEFGKVTGILGPNGAGKTTLLKIILGLIKPSSGTALIGGSPHREMRNASQRIGAVLEMTGFYPGCSAYSHLRIIGDAIGATKSDVLSALVEVGLDSVKSRQVSKLSLGMRQRLQIAASLLLDPNILIFDEPTNGLDPEGIIWFRSIAKTLALNGKAVLIASHILSEMEVMLENVLIFAKGDLKLNSSISKLESSNEIEIQSDQISQLLPHLKQVGAIVTSTDKADTVLLKSIQANQVGELAQRAGVALKGLRERSHRLEDVYLSLVTQKG